MRALAVERTLADDLAQGHRLAQALEQELLLRAEAEEVLRIGWKLALGDGGERRPLAAQHREQLGRRGADRRADHQQPRVGRGPTRSSASNAGSSTKRY